jgi:hypothetical protein
MPQTCEFACDAVHCPPTGGYYVTCVDGPQWWKMAGPYQTHAEALADVDRARDIANKIDGRAWFMGWGTAQVKEGATEPGRLNKLKLF